MSFVTENGEEIGDRKSADTERSPAQKKMPFGKQKGRALGEIDTKDLESTVEWCSSDDEKRKRFAGLIAACSAVVRGRLGKTAEPVDAADYADDDENEIPF